MHIITETLLPWDYFVKRILEKLATSQVLVTTGKTKPKTLQSKQTQQKLNTVGSSQSNANGSLIQNSQDKVVTRKLSTGILTEYTGRSAQISEVKESISIKK